MFNLGNRSLSKLEGVHPDLVAVVRRAIQVTDQDFSVIEGLRTVDRQRELVAKGKSTTMNSRHLTGHAVDLVPYPVSWDWDYFYPIADAMIVACKELGVPLRWGGNWRINDLRTSQGSAYSINQDYTGNFPDAPHLELPRGYGYD